MSTDRHDLSHLPSARLRAALRVVAGLGLFLVIALLGAGVVRDSNLAARETTNQRANTRALCALRDDLGSRFRDTNAFLRAHPHGIPGVSATTLRVSNANTQRTLVALRFVHCPHAN